MPVRDEIAFSTPGQPRRLEARFDAPGDFAREYAQNVSRGGVFIETGEAFELRELVVVDLALAFCGETVALDGEVVSVRPAGLAGAPAGVAVQLLAPPSELRERLGPIAGAASTDPPDDLPEERSAPRTPARVEARVAGAGETVRTLDLSARGALLEVHDDAPAVGESVEISLRHPLTGEERTIEGTVVRHHAPDGALRGVGVRFEPNVACEPGVERFVEEVQAAAHARSLGGIRGSIDPLGLASLLQMFGTSAAQGTLRVVHGDLEGRIGFESGMLRFVRLGEIAGPKALARLMGWRDGGFEFHAHLETQAHDDPPLALDGAIFEAVHQVDELARVELPSVIAQSSLRLDRVRLDAGAQPLGKVEEAVVDLVGAGFTVQRILDVIPVGDAEIHAALRSLLERGVVVSAPRSAAP